MNNEKNEPNQISSASYDYKQTFLYLRHYIFFIILTILFLLCQIRFFNGLIQYLQDTLFTLFLIYCSWNLSYFLHDILMTYNDIFPDDKYHFKDVHKRAVFITGCDSGFGLYLAKNLHQKGYYVITGCLSLQSDGAKELKNSSELDNNNRIFLVEIDVTSDESVSNAKKSVEIFLNSKPDISLWSIVNNAGIMSLCEIEFGNMTIFTKQMNVNGLGVVRVTRTFLPLLRNNNFGRARIVNVASLAGRFTMPGFVAYCMSKAVVIVFSDGLRRELAKWNIEVVSIEPHLYR